MSDATITVVRGNDSASIIVPGSVLDFLELSESTGTELRDNLLASMKQWLRTKYLTGERLKELTEQLEQITVAD